jgi:hypothetical protein
MLDGVCVVWAGLFEESLEVAYRPPHLALDTTPGDCGALLVRAIRFFVVVDAVGGP